MTVKKNYFDSTMYIKHTNDDLLLVTDGAQLSIEYKKKNRPDNSLMEDIGFKKISTYEFNEALKKVAEKINSRTNALEDSGILLKEKVLDYISVNDVGDIKIN